MEWDAEKYEDTSKMQFQIGQQTIALLNPQFNENILDIGCGTGSLSLQIAAKIGDGIVTGVDPDASMVQFAREAIDRNQVANFRVMQADATQLDFLEEFDAVFSNIVLHWVPNVPKLFQVLYAALNPGGRLVITTLYNDRSTGIAEKATVGELETRIFSEFFTENHTADIFPTAELQAYIATVAGKFYCKFLRLHELHRMLEKAGFQDVHFDEKLMWAEYETLDAFMDSRETSGVMWLETLFYFPAKYRDDARLRLRELFRAAWEDLPEEQRECPIREKWPVMFESVSSLIDLTFF
jgi:ubiquinone/menaquinone biosynthesis C-methylase UbiE